MANEVLTKTGTTLEWFDGTDRGGEDYLLDLTSLANGAARQGGKGDLGALRAPEYAIMLEVEMAVAPAATGPTIDLYWAPSPHATAATQNPGGCSGADAVYTGTAGATLDASLKQLMFIGSLVLTADATAVVQRQTFKFKPPHRYGMPVVDNNSGQAFHSSAANVGVILYPLIPEIQ